ncbi:MULTISPECIES: CU044_2847 family protein [Streptomyces]|uniref:Trypsin-co-occurring domain-containing protein n=1 Tax=Streptomyces dengpaensis TaxID=2049881 RepID=A0ABM6T1C6_9ACTN|nr:MULTISPECIES: CU044_2847 family protein [Streptomyces]AVH60473.1 hypothetical protein C4B68_37075 [Streptomyces dengpaensis]PIB07608.1 hypothetical protein B1C81_18970 [Streptomyces sp. HG99]
MATKLIRLADGTLVEVEVPTAQARRISGGVTDNVNSRLDQIDSLLVSVCKPLLSAWRALGEEVSIEQAQVEVGLSFEGEGNIFITKAKAGANLTVTLTITRREGR